MLRNDPPEGIAATPLDARCCHWQASVTGPAGSPYEGGVFYLYIQVPYSWVLSLSLIHVTLYSLSLSVFFLTVSFLNFELRIVHIMCLCLLVSFLSNTRALLVSVVSLLYTLPYISLSVCLRLWYCQLFMQFQCSMDARLLWYERKYVLFVRTTRQFTEF